MNLHQPFTQEELTPILEDFFLNGAATIRRVLSADQCEQMCRHINQVFDEPYFVEMRNVKTKPEGPKPIMVHRLFECDQMFRDLLIREPIISIAETALGPQCHSIVPKGVSSTDEIMVLIGFTLTMGWSFPSKMNLLNGTIRVFACQYCACRYKSR